LSDLAPQNVIRISSAFSPTPKSNRTLGHRSSQPSVAESLRHHGGA